MILEFDKSSQASLIDSVRSQIRGQIEKGELHVGDRLPSLRQLEKQTGASLGIIRQGLMALANEGFLSIEHGRGIFVADPLASKKSIALVVPSVNLENVGRLMQGIKEGLRNRSADLVLQSADMDFDEEAEFIRRLSRSTIAGALVYPPLLSNYAAVFRQVQESGIPLVLIDTVPQGVEGISSVTTDEKMTGYMAFSLLLKHGHRNIGVVDTWGDAATIMSIRAGARMACAESGVDFDALPKARSKFLADESREMPWLAGERQTAELLAMASGITGIVAMDENLAAGALRGLQRAGRRIPDDVSLVSLGDLAAFRLSTPNVTAVDRPHERIGRIAATRLLKRIGNANAPAQVVTRLDPVLIERGSVGPVAPVKRRSAKAAERRT